MRPPWLTINHGVRKPAPSDTPHHIRVENSTVINGRSPAIDAGVMVKEVPADRDGKPRPQGDKVDIGAYEFSGATAEAVSAQPK